MLVAFTAGNLEAVARMARQRYPDREIIIAKDDDHEKLPNAGRTITPGAARVVGAKVCFPSFLDPQGKSDFNDMMIEQGIEAVKAALAAAKDPEPAQAPDDWPEILPLPDGLPPVAAFDDALLPESLRGLRPA